MLYTNTTNPTCKDSETLMKGDVMCKNICVQHFPLSLHDNKRRGCLVARRSSSRGRAVLHSELPLFVLKSKKKKKKIQKQMNHTVSPIESSVPPAVPSPSLVDSRGER